MRLSSWMVSPLLIELACKLVSQRQIMPLIEHQRKSWRAGVSSCATCCREHAGSRGLCTPGCRCPSPGAARSLRRPPTPLTWGRQRRTLRRRPVCRPAGSTPQPESARHRRPRRRRAGAPRRAAEGHAAHQSPAIVIDPGTRGTFMSAVRPALLIATLLLGGCASRPINNLAPP